MKNTIISGLLPNNSSYASTTAQEQDLWELLEVKDTTNWTKIFRYVQNTWSWTIASWNFVQFDISEDSIWKVEQGWANNYACGRAVCSMTTLTYAWIQVAWYISGITWASAGQNLLAAASGWYTEAATLAANVIWTSVITSATEAQLKGLI